MSGAGDEPGLLEADDGAGQRLGLDPLDRGQLPGSERPGPRELSEHAELLLGQPGLPPPSRNRRDNRSAPCRTAPAIWPTSRWSRSCTDQDPTLDLDSYRVNWR